MLIAANYYVAATGDNNAVGSREQPWASIQYAVNQAVAGDTVFVRGGLYNESVTFPRSGLASGGYITLINAPGEQPIIDGAGLINSVAWPQGLVRILNKSYIGVSGFKIRNFKTSNNSFFPAGIWVRGAAHHIIIANNKVHSIEMTHAEGGAHGIAVYGTKGDASIHDIEIRGNEIYNCKLGWSESLVLNGNVEKFVVQDNSIHDNNNIAYDFIGHEGECPVPENDQARDGLVVNNVAYNIDSRSNPSYGGEASADGFYVDGGRDIIFERNIAYRCNIGFEIASEHGDKSTSGIIMRNNLIYNNHMVGLAIGGYDAQRGSADNCFIVNNTFYKNNTRSSGWGAELLVNYYCRDNIFKNNIFYGKNGIALVLNETKSGSNNSYDFNLYFSDGTPRWVWQDGEFTGFADYQSASGQEEHSLWGDPLFRNIGEKDCRLVNDSPAVDAGENMTVEIVGALDFYGDSRVANNRIDVGAAEHHGVDTSILSAPNSPFSFQLDSAFPNPFNPRTTIRYHLNAAAYVTLTIYDVLGRKIKTLVAQRQMAGEYMVKWDGLDQAGALCPGGIYFAVLEADRIQAIKLALVK